MKSRIAATLLVFGLLFGGTGVAEAAQANAQPVQTRFCGYSLSMFSLWWGCYLTGYCRVC